MKFQPVSMNLPGHRPEQDVAVHEHIIYEGKDVDRRCTAVLLLTESGLFTIGVALPSKKDQFSRAVGKSIARKRALQQLIHPDSQSATMRYGVKMQQSGDGLNFDPYLVKKVMHLAIRITRDVEVNGLGVLAVCDATTSVLLDTEGLFEPYEFEPTEVQPVRNANEALA